MNNHESPSKVFWDWDGVLGMQRFWHVRMEADSDLRDFADRLFADQQLVNAWMRGQASLAEVCERVQGDYSARELESILHHDWSQPNAVNKALFSQIAQQYPSAEHYISTDNMDIFHAFADTNQFITDSFIKVYNSADIGVLKGDTPGMYEHILTDLSLDDFSDCLVLDDNVAPCERFRSLGGRALLVRDFTI